MLRRIGGAVAGGSARVGWGALIAAKAVCCGFLLLFLTGALTLNGVLGWLRNGNLAWFLLAGTAATAGIIIWFRQRWRDRCAADDPRSLETKGTP